jgi:hypothetical protein
MSVHDDERLHRLVRASLAPTADAAAPHDLWADVLSGLDERPTVSRTDKGLVAALVAFGVLVPESILLVMYSL